MDLSLSRLYIKINCYKLLNILSIIFIDTGVPIPNKPACIMMPMKYIADAIAPTCLPVGKLQRHRSLRRYSEKRDQSLWKNKCCAYQILFCKTLEIFCT